MSKKEKQQEGGRIIEDYSKYAFRPHETLDFSPGQVDQLYNFLNSLIITDGVGTRMLTEPLFDYVHNETGEVAKKNTSKKKLDEQYHKVFSFDRSIQAEPVQYLTEVGKIALSLMREIEKVRQKMLDDGKGDLQTVLQEEAMAQVQAMQKPLHKVEDEPVKNSGGEVVENSEA
jgi:hypothetical protein